MSEKTKKPQQLSEKKLKELSKDVFERNDVNALYATSDGNFFTPANKSQYHDHLNKGKESGLKGYTFKNTAEKEAEQPEGNETGDNGGSEDAE